MLIDLKNIDHEKVLRNQERNRIRIKLSHKTARELRDFAREHHIPLAGVNTKHDVLNEIMSQWGHVWMMKEDEIG